MIKYTFVLFKLLVMKMKIQKTKKIKKKTAREERRNKIRKINKQLIERFMKVLDCDDKKALPALCLEAWHSLEDVERGSLSQDAKAISLL